jgi:hypothetical protein
MSLYKKFGSVLAVLVALFVAYYAFSLYIVSKLDGTGGVQAPATTMQQYSSEDGVTFQYPDTYRLTSQTNTAGGFTWDSLVLIDKNYVAPVNGEGPTAISMSVFDNAEGLPLEQWIKNEPRSNYKLSAEGTPTKGAIGGKESLAYQYSGLYENDAVAVAHNGKIFLFSDSWMQTVDPIRQDFNKILSTVQFQ